MARGSLPAALLLAAAAACAACGGRTAPPATRAPAASKAGPPPEPTAAAPRVPGPAGAARQPIHAHMTSERVAEEVVDDGATPAVDRIPAGDRRSVPALRAALADKAYATRSAAAKHLGRLGDAATAALPDLARALQDPAGTVRVSAALAHWRISTHPERAVECLRDVLRRGGMALRIEAAWALGAMGSAAAPAVPELTSLVEGHLARTGTPLGYGDGKMVVEPGYLDTTARSAAADALAALGDRSRHVRAALERLGASGTRCEREAASQALAALGGR